MANKPIVDGLAQQYAKRVRFMRVDLLTPAGRELGARYNFVATPHFVGFDSHGKMIWTQRALPPSTSLLDQLTN